MNSEIAETIGLKALAWIAGNEDLLPVFMGATGTSEADLKDRAMDPELLGALLDFLLMDDAWITAFCEANGLAFDQPMQARQALPGGAPVHWT